METLQRTPLFEFHQRHGARLVPFAGWEMPVQYIGILEEHRAVRTAAGLFDVSHMGELRFTGPQAAACLDFIVTNDVSRLKVGRGLYTVMCYPEGGVVDDLIIYRLADDDYLAVVNAGNLAKDVAWIRQYAPEFDCEVRDESAHHALLALQGPNARKILGDAQGQVATLARFGMCDGDLGGAPVRFARTGYTGEDGFEIFVTPADVEGVAEHLLEVGRNHGLQLAGLGARDSLRLEAGFPLYGHELSPEITPYEAGLGWVVKLSKPGDFLGKSALAEEASGGSERRLVWFRMNDRRIARQDTAVYQQDRLVGRVTSGTHSPMLNAPIGAALVDTRDLDEARLEVDLRGRRIPLTVSTPPLHSR